MKTFEQIDFEKLNDDTTEAAYYLQEEKCEKLIDEIQKSLTHNLIKQFNNLCDQLYDLRNLSNMIFYKLGMKKAADIFLDGIV